MEPSNKRIKLARRSAGVLTGGRRARSLCAVRQAVTRNVSGINDAQNREDVPCEERE